MFEVEGAHAPVFHSKRRHVANHFQRNRKYSSYLPLSKQQQYFIWIPPINAGTADCLSRSECLTNVTIQVVTCGRLTKNPQNTAEIAKNTVKNTANAGVVIG